jgi:hypothetical protein
MLHVYTCHSADAIMLTTRSRSYPRVCGTRSWEQAERNARKKEAEADPTRVDQVKPRRTTVKDAIRMCPQR